MGLLDRIGWPRRRGRRLRVSARSSEPKKKANTVPLSVITLYGIPTRDVSKWMSAHAADGALKSGLGSSSNSGAVYVRIQTSVPSPRRSVSAATFTSASCLASAESE